MLKRRYSLWIGSLVGLALLLVIGCEKGGLGVKPGIVVGSVFDALSPTVPLANVDVRLESKQTQSAQGAQVQIGASLYARTDERGQYTFQDVPLGQFFLTYYRPDYEPIIKGATNSPEIYINGGETLSVTPVYMTKIANALATSGVFVKGFILDGSSRDELRPTDVLNLYFDGSVYYRDPTNPAVQTTYADFKNGLLLPAKQGNYRLTIVVDGYKPYQNDTLIDGSIDNLINIELERISYAVRISLLNKPEYITDSVIEFSNGNYSWVNNRADKCLLTVIASSTIANTPDKILATGVLSLQSYVPQVTLEGISLPSTLKMQLSGYTTMNFQIPTQPNLQGVIELNIDMSGTYVKAHQIKVPVRLDVYAKLEEAANASSQIQLAWTDQTWVRALDVTWGPDTLQNVELQINNLPCGYVIPFDVHTFSIGWDFINSVAARGWFTTTNYYYIEPVRVNSVAEAANATFTAHLMISRTDAIYPRTPGAGGGGGN